MSFFRSRTFTAGNAAIFFVIGLAVRRRVLLPPAAPDGAPLRPVAGGAAPDGVDVARSSSSRPVVGALVDRIGERPLMVSGLLIQCGGHGMDRRDRAAGLAVLASRRAADRRRRRDLDGDSRGAELGGRVGDDRDRRQARRHQQHDARARAACSGSRWRWPCSPPSAATPRLRRSPTASARRSRLVGARAARCSVRAGAAGPPPDARRSSR